MKNGKLTAKQTQVALLENAWAVTHGEESKNHDILEEMKHEKKKLHQIPTWLSPFCNRMPQDILSFSHR